jgi:hypothetical protein
MRIAVFTLALGSLVFAAAGDVAAAKPKQGYRPPLVHRYDFNQDGKINTMERANARMSKAQQREWRAVQRNNAMVR